MTVERKNAPYAPPSNVIAIIRRFRERNLPESIDVNLLQDVGISKGNVHRTLAALEFLGLIAEDGTPKDAFHGIQIAPDEGYTDILEGLVRGAYREVFQVVDPVKDNQSVIGNHFRRYQPSSQRGRMVTLFLALCREAGITTLDAPRERTIRGAGPASGRAVKAPAAHRVTAKATSANIVSPQPSTTNVQNLSVASLRAAYIAALIEQVRQSAAQGKDMDTNLLDRIERLMAEEERPAPESLDIGGEGTIDIRTR